MTQTGLWNSFVFESLADTEQSCFSAPPHPFYRDLLPINCQSFNPNSCLLWLQFWTVNLWGFFPPGLSALSCIGMAGTVPWLPDKSSPSLEFVPECLS